MAIQSGLFLAGAVAAVGVLMLALEMPAKGAAGMCTLAVGTAGGAVALRRLHSGRAFAYGWTLALFTLAASAAALVAVG